MKQVLPRLLRPVAPFSVGTGMKNNVEKHFTEGNALKRADKFSLLTSTNDVCYYGTL